jgi:hypothetical protein
MGALMVFLVFLAILLVTAIATLLISLIVGGLTFFKKRKLGLAIIFLAPSAPVGCFFGVYFTFFITDLTLKFKINPSIILVGSPILAIVIGLVLTVVSWAVLSYFEKSKKELDFCSRLADLHSELLMEYNFCRTISVFCVTNVSGVSLNFGKQGETEEHRPTLLIGLLIAWLRWAVNRYQRLLRVVG